MQHFADRWAALSEFIGKLLERGVEPEWERQPPLDMDFGEFRRANQEEAKLIDQEHKKLLSAEAIEPVKDSGGCVCRMFLVSKKSGGQRPVINLKPVNPFVVYRHFKMEGLQNVKEQLEERDWMVTVDLRDAYLHVPIEHSARRFFRFRHQGQVFQWKTLPFGYRDSPRIFTKIMRVVAQQLRLEGIRLVVYLDDILIMARSEAECIRHRDRVVEFLQYLGLTINTEKSQLTPSQEKAFLGVLVNSLTMTFAAPQDKVKAIRKEVRRMARVGAKGRLISLKALQRLLGKLQSLSECVTAIRLHMNHLFQAKNRAAISEQERTLLRELEVAELQWWSEHLEAWNGKGVIPAVADHSIATDASDLGWGAVWIWLGKRCRAHGFFPLNYLCHNNVRELQAILFEVMAFVNSHKLSDCKIRVLTDNLVALSYVNRYGGKVPSLVELTTQLHNFALERRIVVVAEYIPGELNTEADEVSRLENDTLEASLHQEAFKLINQEWGPLTLDCFASMANAKLPDFVSWRPDPMAAYVDFFSQPASRKELLYAYPPFILIGRLLQKMRLEQLDLVLVAPVWPAQAWWPTLMASMVDFPLLLPRIPGLFSTPRSSEEEPLPPRWWMIACLVSGRPSAREDWTSKLSRSSSATGSRASKERALWTGIKFCGPSGYADAEREEVTRLLCKSLTSSMW